MTLYTPDDSEFAALAARHEWFEHVLAASCGELEGDDEIPATLDWTALIPPALALEFTATDCSLAYVNGEYAVTVWDATGEGDAPWGLFLADDAGVRLLPEYSVLDPDAPDAAFDAALARAAEELPGRLLAREFDRVDAPAVPIPDWLAIPTYKPEAPI